MENLQETATDGEIDNQNRDVMCGASVRHATILPQILSQML